MFAAPFALIQVSLLLGVSVSAKAIPYAEESSRVQLVPRATCSSTAGIKPLPIHSHNDYTRNVPLCDALNNAASSIEADVWWADNLLYVAHTAGEEDASKTLDSLYIQELLSMLNAQNPSGVKPGVKPNGLFVSSPSTTLQFLIDFKSDGDSTFQPVVNALKPLADAGYLTKYENGVLTESAITVVGTGNTPFAMVQAMSPRTIFYDAPLNSLASSPQYISTISPLASADFGTTIGWLGILPISSSQRATIKQWFSDAHSRGIKARFYDTPDFLVPVMEQVWIELLNDGEDWLNADHLTDAKNTYTSWLAGQ